MVAPVAAGSKSVKLDSFAEPLLITGNCVDVATKTLDGFTDKFLKQFESSSIRASLGRGGKQVERDIEEFEGTTEFLSAVVGFQKLSGEMEKDFQASVNLNVHGMRKEKILAFYEVDGLATARLQARGTKEVVMVSLPDFHDHLIEQKVAGAKSFSCEKVCAHLQGQTQSTLQACS